jgi:hypothetical protein
VAGARPTRYLVLARREYGESLSYQGMLDAAGDRDPGSQATDRFGREWLELVLAPEGACHWVLRPEAGAESPA